MGDIPIHACTRYDRLQGQNVVFELFLCAYASLIGPFSQKAGGEFLSQTLIYSPEMAIVGAVAGVGRLVGEAADSARGSEPAARLHLDAGSKRKEQYGGENKPSEDIQDVLTEPGTPPDWPRQ